MDLQSEASVLKECSNCTFQEYLDTRINRSIWNGTEACRPISSAFPDLIDGNHVRGIIGACYVLIWLLGVGGNALVLYMVLWRRMDFSVRTVFIVSLAFSDLLMALTSLPVTAISTFTRVWQLPGFLCYSIGLLQASSVFVSSFTLIVIAVDRYYLICYPHSVSITYQRALLAVATFWIIGVTLAIPMSIFMKMDNLEEKAGICGYACMEDWPGWLQPYGKRAYGLAVFIVQYGSPMILCSIFYVEISVHISDQFERRKQTQVVTAETADRSLQRRRRANRMMVSMVMTFVLSWLPFNMANLIRDFDLFEYILPVEYFSITFAAAHLVAMTSVLWNPLIYSFFNHQFRAAVKQILAGRSKGFNGNREKATWL